MGATMDERTRATYDREAAVFAREWEEQPAPTDLHALIGRYFRSGPTADIGCGSGRDTAWLNANGFPAVGYDASEGLLAEARRLHPDVSFQTARLPELVGVAEGGFTNVLCETVIMHLDSAVITASVRRLVAILEPGGILYLSWRVTEGSDRRDDHGRLYAAFDPALVFEGLGSADVLGDEQLDSRSSGKLVRRIVARKVVETA
jgi:SAM-dependent methyltransferase